MAMKQRPTKRVKLLDDDANISGSESNPGVGHNGTKLSGELPGGGSGFKINEEYAKRFDHNKKRAEQHRLEEKYGRDSSARRDDSYPSSEDDSEDGESEDDDAEFATQTVDAEILATLQAIKSKDPRVYDPSVNFYKEYNEDSDLKNGKSEDEEPMYLIDYHRRNLMEGHVGDEDDDAGPKQTYADEQEQLKQELIGSMHANAAANVADDEDEFLVAKPRPKRDTLLAAGTERPKRITDADIAGADRDPETYLSNFMTARAWLPSDGSRWKALESDDSDDDQRAERFEEAYNLRFEDPQNSNAVLKSFSRDVGLYSVRRDDKSGRKKVREREREQNTQAKRERDEDRARLRKLKIEEAEEKVKRIKDAAGLRGGDVDLEQWRDMIEADFDDGKWEAEMKRRFGDEYYAEGEDHTGDNGKTKKLKKPMWKDDIGIHDLVPNFEDEHAKPGVTLSSDDDADAYGLASDGESQSPPGGVRFKGGDNDSESDSSHSHKQKTKRDRAREKAESKSIKRRERRAIEDIVDASLPLTTQTTGPGFRYRDTSPTSFGLTARDILFADDAQLNRFAGLKKLASWRDETKKRRDRKSLSKKARVREWRKETFGGDGKELTAGFERISGTDHDQDGAVRTESKERRAEEGHRKKRKRSKKNGKREDGTLV